MENDWQDKYKRLRATLITLVIFMMLFIVAYAKSSFIVKREFRTQNVKGHIFKIDLTGNTEMAELLPGSTFSITPAIKNTGTDDIYCFIKVKIYVVYIAMSPEPVFTFDIHSNWELIKTNEDSDSNGYFKEFVYGYMDEGALSVGNHLLQALSPGNTTTSLTDSMTLNDDNSMFYVLDNEQVNVTVTGIGIWVDGEEGNMRVYADPNEAWNMYLTFGEQ